jgi:hypothetical protein
MRLGGLAAMTASSAAIVLAGWVTFGGLSGPDATEAMDAGGQTIAAKGLASDDALEAADDNDAATGALPVADAARVDSSLFSPYTVVAVQTISIRQSAAPQPAPQESSVQPVALAYADTPDQDVTGSVIPAAHPAEKPVVAVSRPAAAPAGQDVKKAMVPKLDKDNLLTPAQLAQIKANLNLTPDQERHWAPVEAELKQLARQLAAQKAAGRKPTLSLGATDAQRLYWAAGPLIMSLREDQKREVRRLARAMGLEQVASLI